MHILSSSLLILSMVNSEHKNARVLELLKTKLPVVL